jgi:hypothetical protein
MLMQTERSKRNDPWMREFEMPFRASYYPLGFPLTITTNSTEVLTGGDEPRTFGIAYEPNS